MDNRYRPRSPPGRRAYHDPRASTGFISTSFEPAYPSYPRSAIDPYSSRHGSIYEQPKRYAYQGDAYGGTTSRTEYPVSAYNRPRNNSTLSAEGRRPLSMMSKNTSPPRYKPVVSNVPRDVPRSPPLGPSRGPGESTRYLVPARTSGSEHHQRHYSANRTDNDRLIPATRGPRRGEYHQSGGYESSKGYAGARGVKDDDFSYTGPREQFDRDYPVRSAPSRDPYVRRERPVSVMEIPEHKAPPTRRDMGPPPGIPRQSDRLEPVRRSGFDSDPDRGSDLPQRRHSMRAPVVHQQRDDNYGPPRDDLDRPTPKARRDRLDDDDAATIKLRQRELDAQYDREKEQRREREKELEREKEREYLRERELRERDRGRDRDWDRERERDKPRDRERDRDRDKDRERERERARPPPHHEKSKRADEERGGEASPERSGIAKAAAAGLAGAGATAVANAVLKSKKPDDASDSDERKERRRRHHRHHEHEDNEADPREAEPRERRSKVPVVPVDDRGQYDSGYGTSKRGDESSESHEDESGKRRHRRSRHHDAREDVNGSSEARLAPPDAHAERELSPGDDGSSRRRRRDKSRNRDAEAAERDAEQRTVSPGENDDDRPRRVQLVEPVDKREDVRPKGILKPQRTTPFPEDPNPTREGVAPLKDAGKQGIPPGARWTKISRMLVNPEALERAHERFEERDEYVIVLRVSTLR